MAPARIEPRVGAALDDSNSRNLVNYGNYGQSSTSIIWAYENNGFDTFGPGNDYKNSSIFDFKA